MQSLPPEGLSRAAPGRASHLARAALLVAVLSALSACVSGENLPPVFGAVFGVTGAPVRPFTEGRVADPVVGPDSRLIGAAAGTPGACIYRDGGGRRFRAPCPEGTDGIARGP